MSEGYHVGRIHSDQGHEFAGEFKRWALQRGIYLTKTPGDDRSGNGRAEMAVKAFKNYIRRTLRQSFEDAKWWPWALRYVNEVERCIRMDQKPEWPRFLQEVRVRKRTWRKDDLSSRVKKVQYLCPSNEASLRAGRDRGSWSSPRWSCSGNSSAWPKSKSRAAFGRAAIELWMAERIQATIRTIAEEEVQLWRDHRSTGRFPYTNEDHQGADLGFDVFRTPCGTVYHSTRACTQLKAGDWICTKVYLV